MIMVITALAGGLGGGCRFLVDSLVSARSRSSVPLGTLVVNVSACFLLGLVTGILPGDAVYMRLILGVGFLGGYSTFSTASVEAARLFIAGRPRAALRHCVVMIFFSLFAAVLGVLLGSWLTAH